MTGRRISLLDEAQIERHGRCKLCGQIADLTKTHVPPRAGGNSGIAQRDIEVVAVLEREFGEGFEAFADISSWLRIPAEQTNPIEAEPASRDHDGRKRLAPRRSTRDRLSAGHGRRGSTASLAAAIPPAPGTRLRSRRS